MLLIELIIVIKIEIDLDFHKNLGVQCHGRHKQSFRRLIFLVRLRGQRDDICHPRTARFGQPVSLTLVVEIVIKEG